MYKHTKGQPVVGVYTGRRYLGVMLASILGFMLAAFPDGVAGQAKGKGQPNPSPKGTTAPPAENPEASQPKPVAPKSAAKDPDPSKNGKNTPATVDRNAKAKDIVPGLCKGADFSEVQGPLSSLEEKKTFATGIDSLVKKVSEYNGDVATCLQFASDLKMAFDSLINENTGAHLVIHYLSMRVDKSLDGSVIGGRSLAKGGLENNSWYLYRPGIGFEEFNGKRLYGVSTLYVLSVAGPVYPLRGDDKDDLQTVRYYSVVEKKLAANVQNFISLLAFATGGGVQAAAPMPTYYFGFGSLKKIPYPSNVTLGAFMETDDPTKIVPVGTSVELDNEKRAWWDVSVGFPVTKVEDLQYDQTNGAIQTKKADKTSVLALGQIFLYPSDLKNPGRRWSPAFIAGVGIEGKLRDRYVLGLSTNLPPIHGLSFTKSNWYQFIRPYAGVQFTNTERPIPNAPPGTPQLEPYTVRKLTLGISIPVVSSIKRLMAAKADTSTSKDKGTAAKGTGSDSQVNPATSKAVGKGKQ